MTQHWHAYTYTGRAYPDGAVRQGQAPADFPPFLVEDWLRRPPRSIEATFFDIDQAVGWLETQLKQNQPVDAEGIPIPERLRAARARLGEQVQKDVVWGWYTTRQDFASRALIACPRPKRHMYADDSPPPCPTP
ncbi:hypothetical protein [Streptomyces albofaciens]|uniref:hypothetical protein n=1 Tax=Streptomyces albofaciens TaxID=66866 RepID=UPI001FCA868E|nr:hypothetical protein [Streptomyces albofaciens]